MLSIEEMSEIWRGCQAYFKGRIPGNAYMMFIDSLKAVKAEKGVWTLGTGNPLVAKMAESYCRDISGYLKMTLGQDYKVVIVAGSEYQSPEPGGIQKDPLPVGLAEVSPKKAPARAVSRRSSEYSCTFNKRNTFDAFVVGNSNRFAQGFCKAVAANPGASCNPLFIYGGSGMGKTHLLQAVGQQIQRSNPAAKIIYISGEDFCNGYINSLAQKNVSSFRKHYNDADVLLVDDIHFLMDKKQTQEIFFNIFNTLHAAGHQIVVTSDRPPRQLKDFTERMITRFEGGGVAEIQSAEYETRLAILKKKQNCQNMKFSDGVLALIAKRISSSIRKLEAALFNLITRCCIEAKNEEISMTMAADMKPAEAEMLLCDMFADEEMKVLNIAQIQKLVAEHYDVRVADLVGKARPANIAVPRQVAMYLARMLTKQSFPAIAEQFNRNHATILHALKVIDDKMEKDVEFRQEIQRLEHMLRS